MSPRSGARRSPGSSAGWAARWTAEIIHYPEWVHVVRNRIASELQTVDVTHIHVTSHVACHYYTMVHEYAVYDPTVLGVNRIALITSAARTLGAPVIATECPTCHSGLEMHQVRAETEFGIKTSVKVLYFTQLLGLAMGLSSWRLGIHENVSDSIGFLKGKGVAV